ncbi:MAG TPA: hypothetical protein VIS74_07705 [Chthoniobacterales bacterium]
MSELDYLRPVHRKTSLREWILMAVILGMLAVIVSAIFLKQQGDARLVAGSRNLQQWGIALNLYLIDNDNQLPGVGGVPVAPEQTQAWYNSLPPYISGTPLADLPPGKRPRPGVPSPWIDPASRPVRVWDASQFYFEYGMNQALQPDSRARSFQIYEIDSPAHVVFMAPVSEYAPAATPGRVVFRYGGNPGGPNASAFVLFCDGHVEKVTRARLVQAPASRLAASVAAGKLSWFEK